MGNEQKNLKDFMKQQYYVILMKKSDIFYLHIPELSLIVEDRDLNKAYERLETAKETYFKKAAEMNLQNEIESPSSISLKTKKNLVSLFGPFFVKLCCIFVVCLVLLNLTAAIAKYVSYEIKSIPYEVVNKVSRMSEEDVLRKRLLLRETLKKLKPFIDEFRTAFSETTDKKDN